MENKERLQQILDETEILKFPDGLISTSKATTLHYYVLAEPYYLEVFENEGPETKIREGEITWEKPKLLTPGYILKMEGFSEKSREVLKMIADQNPDLASLLYKLKYKKEYEETVTISKSIEETKRRIEDDINDNDKNLSAIIKGIDEYWDVSLMKFIQELIMKSAYSSQMSDYTKKGYVTMDENGMPRVTRNLEGLPIAAKEEIDKMFSRAKKGDIEPAQLKQELDRWGVFSQYEDRFFDLFRKE